MAAGAVLRHRRGYSTRAIVERFDHHAEDVLFNVAYALSLRALHRMSGEPRFLRRAERAEAALMERCWDGRRGLFLDLATPPERRVAVSTWSSLTALGATRAARGGASPAGGGAPSRSARYGAPVGIPSVSMEEPAFRAGFDRFRCWRDPSWVNTAWLLVPPLRELGHEEEAQRIVRSLTDTVERQGFREYYNPFTGKGHGARDFGWSTLVVDL